MSGSNNSMPSNGYNIQGGPNNGNGYIQGGPTGEYGGDHGAVTVEPEFVIHTTTCLHPQHMGTPGTSTTLPSGGASTSDSQSTTSSTSSSGGNDLVTSFPHQVTTTVTASTKFKGFNYTHLHHGDDDQEVVGSNLVGLIIF
ncbi:hypothetical protein WDU94_000454 [Cyamophila willieti]